MTPHRMNIFQRLTQLFSSKHNRNHHPTRPILLSPRPLQTTSTGTDAATSEPPTAADIDDNNNDDDDDNALVAAAVQAAESFVLSLESEEEEEEDEEEEEEDFNLHDCTEITMEDIMPPPTLLSPQPQPLQKKDEAEEEAEMDAYEAEEETMDDKMVIIEEESQQQPPPLPQSQKREDPVSVIMRMEMDVDHHHVVEGDEGEDATHHDHHPMQPPQSPPRIRKPFNHPPSPFPSHALNLNHLHKGSNTKNNNNKKNNHNNPHLRTLHMECIDWQSHAILEQSTIETIRHDMAVLQHSLSEYYDCNNDEYDNNNNNNDNDGKNDDKKHNGSNHTTTTTSTSTNHHEDDNAYALQSQSQPEHRYEEDHYFRHVVLKRVRLAVFWATILQHVQHIIVIAIQWQQSSSGPLKKTTDYDDPQLRPPRPIIGIGDTHDDENEDEDMVDTTTNNKIQCLKNHLEEELYRLMDFVTKDFIILPSSSSSSSQSQPPSITTTALQQQQQRPQRQRRIINVCRMHVKKLMDMMRRLHDSADEDPAVKEVDFDGNDWIDQVHATLWFFSARCLATPVWVQRQYKDCSPPPSPPPPLLLLLPHDDDKYEPWTLLMQQQLEQNQQFMKDWLLLNQEKTRRKLAQEQAQQQQQAQPQQQQEEAQAQQEKSEKDPPMIRPPLPYSTVETCSPSNNKNNSPSRPIRRRSSPSLSLPTDAYHMPASTMYARLPPASSLSLSPPSSHQQYQYPKRQKTNTNSSTLVLSMPQLTVVERASLSPPRKMPPRNNPSPPPPLSPIIVKSPPPSSLQSPVPPPSSSSQKLTPTQPPPPTPSPVKPPPSPRPSPVVKPPSPATECVEPQRKKRGRPKKSKNMNRGRPKGSKSKRLCAQHTHLRCTQSSFGHQTSLPFIACNHSSSPCSAVSRSSRSQPPICTLSSPGRAALLSLGQHQLQLLHSPLVRVRAPHSVFSANVRFSPRSLSPHTSQHQINQGQPLITSARDLLTKKHPTLKSTLVGTSESDPYECNFYIEASPNVQSSQSSNRVGRSADSSKSRLSSSGRSKFHDSRWYGNFTQLQEFHRLHGNCWVPRVFPNNQAFSNWVHNQRYCKTLSLQRISLLKSLDFETKAAMPIEAARRRPRRRHVECMDDDEDSEDFSTHMDEEDDGDEDSHDSDKSVDDNFLVDNDDYGENEEDTEYKVDTPTTLQAPLPPQAQEMMNVTKTTDPVPMFQAEVAAATTTTTAAEADSSSMNLAIPPPQAPETQGVTGAATTADALGSVHNRTRRRLEDFVIPVFKEAVPPMMTMTMMIQEPPPFASAESESITPHNNNNNHKNNNSLSHIHSRIDRRRSRDEAALDDYDFHQDNGTQSVVMPGSATAAAAATTSSYCSPPAGKRNAQIENDYLGESNQAEEEMTLFVNRNSSNNNHTEPNSKREEQEAAVAVMVEPFMVVADPVAIVAEPAGERDRVVLLMSDDETNPPAPVPLKPAPALPATTANAAQQQQHHHHHNYYHTKHPFTKFETDAIVEGVRIFGWGKWAEIKEHFAVPLLHRTRMQIMNRSYTMKKQGFVFSTSLSARVLPGSRSGVADPVAIVAEPAGNPPAPEPAPVPPKPAPALPATTANAAQQHHHHHHYHTKHSFTKFENDAIVEGVRIFGWGKWAEIKKHFAVPLLHRTCMQIKDRGYTMKKKLCVYH